MASSISKELQEFVKGKLGWVATANQEGMPNVTPKGADSICKCTTQGLPHDLIGRPIA